MGFYQTMLLQYGAETVRLLKQWSSLNYKMASLKNRKIFLLSCRYNGLTPTHILNNTKNLAYLIENTDSRTGQITLDFIHNLNRKILNLEIDTTYKNTKNLEKKINEISIKLNSLISINILEQFFETQRKSHENIFKKIKKSNIDKLNRLKNSLKSELLKIDENWIKDYSEIEIPDDIKKFLALGHKFSIKPEPKDLNMKTLLADIENLIYMYPNNQKNIIRAKVTNVITNYKFQPAHNNYLRHLFLKTKKFFKNHEDILITKADKGNITVIIKKEDYLKKSLDILSDNNYYKILPRDPTSTFQQKANQIVTKLKNNKTISPEEAKKMTIYNQTCPKFYGLPKIHKPNIPLRPIISSIDAPNSKLSQFITNILTTSYDYDNIYYTKDTFTFVNFIKNMKLPENYVLISLDAVSLYSNIPYDLIINSITLHWPEISIKTKLNKKQFLNIIELIFNSSYFKFNNHYYKQILGTPMGSNLSPILSQYVMDDLLNNCIPKLKFKLPFIKKFVDDIVTSVPQNSINEILEIFNQYNSHIQFTIEKEKDLSVPFLDTLLIRSDNNIIITDWYTKPTYSGRYINFHSYHTQKIKINLVLGLKNRIFKICHPSFIKKNINKLFDILKKNSYPDWFLKKFLFNTIQIENNDASFDDTINPIILNTPNLNSNNNIINNSVSENLPEVQQNNKIYYFSLPYIKELSKKFEKIFNGNVNIKICGKHFLKISNLFSKYKDTDENLKKSGVVYSIKCNDCDKNYIGQTSTILKERITRHKSDYRLNKRTCSLSEHILDTNHMFDFSNPKILEIEKNSNKRLFLEMINIHNDKNCINKKKDIEDLNIIYSLLLNSISEVT